MPKLAAIEVLTDFRLLFGALVVSLVALLLVTIFTRNSRQSMSFATNLTISLGLLAFSALTIVTENRILALTEMAGDRITFYLFIASLVLGVANPIVHKILHKRSRSYRYRF